jgi:hypothetical protein
MADEDQKTAVLVSETATAVGARESQIFSAEEIAKYCNGGGVEEDGDDQPDNFVPFTFPSRQRAFGRGDDTEQQIRIIAIRELGLDYFDVDPRGTARLVRMGSNGEPNAYEVNIKPHQKERLEKAIEALAARSLPKNKAEELDFAQAVEKACKSSADLLETVAEVAKTFDRYNSKKGMQP